MLSRRGGPSNDMSSWRLKLHPSAVAVEVTDVRLLPSREGRFRSLAGTETVWRRADDFGAVEFTIDVGDDELRRALYRNRSGGQTLALLRPEPGTLVVRTDRLLATTTQQLPGGGTLDTAVRYRATVVSEHPAWI